MAGSRRLMLGEAMSIFARSTCAIGELAGLAHAAEQVEVLGRLRPRNGLSLPGSVSVPRLARISSALWLST
jgi:hypothetical protein